MNIHRLVVAGSSGLLLFAALIFGGLGILNPSEAVALSKPAHRQSVAKDSPLAIPQAITAPTSVSLIPEKLGIVNSSFIFRATVIPTDTTQPISYTWEATGQAPVIHTNGLSDTVSFTWPVSGTQVVTVTAANAWGTATDSYELYVSDLLNLDTMVVFDVSGSMDYETNCFGCWVKDPFSDIMTNPYPTNGTFVPLNYEFNESGGGSTSIFWEDSSTSVAGHAACNALSASKTISGFNYLVHEAEFYARSHPHNGWEFDQRSPGQGFWVLQRPQADENASNNAYISAHPFVTYSQNNVVYIPRLQGAAYDSDCFAENPGIPGEYGPYGDCWSSKGLPETANNNPPYVEYDFTPDWTGDMHIWVRAIGGWSWSFEWDGNNPTAPTFLDPYRTAMFWQIDQGPVGGGEYLLLGRKFRRDEVDLTISSTGRDKWRWVKIADEQNTPPVVAGTQYTLRIYQGSSGFNIDKIIITNNDEGAVGATIVGDTGQTIFAVVSDEADATLAGTATSLGANTPAAKLDIAEDVLSLFNGQGLDVSPGSATREACNRCNPTYGETVNPAQCTCRKDANETGVGTGAQCTFVAETTNHLTNDLFYDRAPFRHAKEAAKNFAGRLNSRFDQLGVVAFNNVTPDRVKLQCLVFGGFDLCAGNPNPITYSFVIRNVEDYEYSNATDIARGLREGLEELGLGVPLYNLNVGHDCPDVQIPVSNSASVLDDDNKQACDRQGAAQRVIILLTDGIPNRWIGYPSDPGGCPDDDVALWRGAIGGGNQAFDCAIFFAEAAANNKVALYTIGMGPGPPHEFLTAMAEGTDPNPLPGDDGFYFEPHCGQYFSVANLNDLDAIFEQILILARSCIEIIVDPPFNLIYLPLILKE